MCSSWKHPGDSALIIASNFAGDSLDFEVGKHPDGYAVAYSIDTFFVSEGLYAFDGESIINEHLSDEIYLRLQTWQSEIDKLSKYFKKNGFPKPGLALDDLFYATLAKLYELRAEMNERAITEKLAGDMGVPVSTAKERIRRARSLGFLSNPGKGGAGQGKATNKANREMKGKK